jgi:hypothetical protein
MKQSDFLETWQDFADIFGPGVALRLKPWGGTLWTIMRLPSRTGWTWRLVKTKRRKTNLRILVTLDDEGQHGIASSKH